MTIKAIEKSTYYSYEIDGEIIRVNFPSNVNHLAFFGEVTEMIAFSDCTDERITKIVFHGVEYKYQGWAPGMYFVYVGSNGEVFDGYYPEYDH